MQPRGGSLGKGSNVHQGSKVHPSVLSKGRVCMSYVPEYGCLFFLCWTVPAPPPPKVVPGPGPKHSV